MRVRRTRGGDRAVYSQTAVYRLYRLYCTVQQQSGGGRPEPDSAAQLLLSMRRRQQRASHCFGDWSKDWLRTVFTEAKAEEVKESDRHHGRVPDGGVLDLLALQLHHRVCRPLLQDVPRRAGGAEDRPRPRQGWLLSVGCGDVGNCDDKVADALSQLGKQIWKLNKSDTKKVWHAYFKLLLNPPCKICWIFRSSNWIIYPQINSKSSRLLAAWAVDM